jgi:hypothetical protein
MVRDGHVGAVAILRDASRQSSATWIRYRLGISVQLSQSDAPPWRPANLPCSVATRILCMALLFVMNSVDTSIRGATAVHVQLRLFRNTS